MNAIQKRRLAIELLSFARAFLGLIKAILELCSVALNYLPDVSSRLHIQVSG